MKFKLLFLLCFMSCIAFGQSKITGQILEAESQKPIASAFVVLVGKNAKPTITDKKGQFKISNLQENDTLMFTANGYIPTMIAVGSAKKIKVILSPDGNKTAVDVGYGTQNSNSITSSVVVVESKDFNNVVSSDIYTYLRGKVPGLNIDNRNPAQPKISLRGSGNFSNYYEPLIVIDGVQNASLTTVDPNDVKSVTVLKDASASAIYGTQGNGGVIIIKTKGGKSEGQK
jgi:TonB-dependent starch-binding outer membrane protein SusC